MILTVGRTCKTGRASARGKLRAVLEWDEYAHQRHAYPLVKSAARPMTEAPPAVNTASELTVPIKRRNERLLYIELIWMGFTFAMDWWYLSVFIIRLGATPVQVGALGSGRALAMVVGTALGSWWQGRFTNLVRALELPMVVARTLLYAVVAVVPSLPITFHVEMIIGTVILGSVLTGIVQAAFLGMLPAAVDKDNLAQVVSTRSFLMNASILVSLVFVGPFLEALPIPQNYQLGFGLAYLSAFVSWLFVRAVKVSEYNPQTERQRKVAVWANPTFRRFALLVLVINTSVFMAAPLVQLQLVRGLKASDGWISFFGIIEMGAGALATIALPRLLHRMGRQVLLSLMLVLMLPHAAILALTPTLPPYTVGILLFGAGWFSLNVLLYNQMVTLVPPEDLRQYAVTYQLLINIALFSGPLLATFLIENVMSIPAALLLATSLRMVATVLSVVLRFHDAER